MRGKAVTFMLNGGVAGPLAPFLERPDVAPQILCRYLADVGAPTQEAIEVLDRSGYGLDSAGRFVFGECESLIYGNKSAKVLCLHLLFGLEATR